MTNNNKKLSINESQPFILFIMNKLNLTHSSAELLISSSPQLRCPTLEASRHNPHLFNYQRNHTIRAPRHTCHNCHHHLSMSRARVDTQPNSTHISEPYLPRCTPTLHPPASPKPTYLPRPARPPT